MNEVLIWWFVGAIAVVVGAFVVTGYLNYRENYLYWKAMLRMLKVGQVKWSMLSPERGKGHTIFVVKEIKKVKRKLFGYKTRIIFDRYIYNGAEYVCDGTDIDYSLGDFYRNTDPEPVYVEDLF